MAYRCCICASNEVEEQGGICELCIIGADPYIVGLNNERISTTQFESDKSCLKGGYIPKKRKNRKILLNSGVEVAKLDSYENDIAESQDATSVQVYSAGQVPMNGGQTTNIAVSNSNNSMEDSSNQPLTTGITKNIVIDNHEKSILSKWFRALFLGVPFTLDNDITMFQVFPDYTGTSLNVMGNACDQVIVYGKLNNGVISENNEVEVYGKRDSNNNIIAKSIQNKASGTTIVPQCNMNSGFVWVITIVIAMLMATIVMILGMEGIIWALVLVFCLTNFPVILKVIGIACICMISIFKRR